MSLAKVLAQQETAVSDARVSQLSECKFLSEQEVIELAAKCKVGRAVSCSLQEGRLHTATTFMLDCSIVSAFRSIVDTMWPCCSA